MNICLKSSEYYDFRAFFVLYNIKLDISNRIIIKYTLNENYEFRYGNKFMKKRMENIFLEGFLNRKKEQYYFEDKDGWIMLITAYLLIHIFLEGVYLYAYCLPMIHINLVSIVFYLIEYYLNEAGYTKTKLWLGLGEIHSHIILATIFMGYNCGFWLWLFAMALAVITPYFMPVFTRRQNILTNMAALMYVATFLIIAIMHSNGQLPVRYNASKNIADFMFCANAIISFSVIIIYSAIYSISIKNNNEKLLNMVNIDYLTGLHTRQYIQKKLDSRINDSSNINIAVGIMDIDHFKQINDMYGHQTGDYILKELSKILQSNDKIHIGRWGGEEFLLMSYSKESYEEFCSALNSLRDDISNHIFSFEGSDIKITASFGTAKYTENMNSKDLIKEADTRLYYAKKHGRNMLISA